MNRAEQIENYLKEHVQDFFALIKSHDFEFDVNNLNSILIRMDFYPEFQGRREIAIRAQVDELK